MKIRIEFEDGDSVEEEISERPQNYRPTTKNGIKVPVAFSRNINVANGVICKTLVGASYLTHNFKPIKSIHCDRFLELKKMNPYPTRLSYLYQIPDGQGGYRTVSHPGSPYVSMDTEFLPL